MVARKLQGAFTCQASRRTKQQVNGCGGGGGGGGGCACSLIQKEGDLCSSFCVFFQAVAPHHVVNFCNADSPTAVRNTPPPLLLDCVLNDCTLHDCVVSTLTYLCITLVHLGKTAALAYSLIEPRKPTRGWQATVEGGKSAMDGAHRSIYLNVLEDADGASCFIPGHQRTKRFTNMPSSLESAPLQCMLMHARIDDVVHVKARCARSAEAKMCQERPPSFSGAI